MVERGLVGLLAPPPNPRSMSAMCFKSGPLLLLLWSRRLHGAGRGGSQTSGFADYRLDTTQH